MRLGKQATGLAICLLVGVAGLETAGQETVSMNVTNASFAAILAPDATLEKLASSMKFIEGPAWFTGDGGGHLVFSDIPGDELKRWSAADGLSVFRAPSRNANGNTIDCQGRLITCEHGSRQVTRTEADGSLVTIAERFDGKRLNSPNDAVVKSDGSIWFTDPPYGLKDRTLREQAGNYVFRLSPDGVTLTAVATDFDMPNGLCFSPDENKLYIADSGKPHHVRVFDVRADGTLGGGAVFCVITPGVPDGIRCDSEGRLWSSAGDGIHVFARDGALLGKIPVPEPPANLCFGGADGHTLFITARTSLYALKVKAAAPSPAAAPVRR